VKRLIEFPLEKGGSILIQVDEPEPAGGKAGTLEKARGRKR